MNNNISKNTIFEKQLSYIYLLTLALLCFVHIMPPKPAPLHIWLDSLCLSRVLPYKQYSYILKLQEELLLEMFSHLFWLFLQHKLVSVSPEVSLCFSKSHPEPHTLPLIIFTTHTALIFDPRVTYMVVRVSGLLLKLLYCLHHSAFWKIVSL